MAFKRKYVPRRYKKRSFKKRRFIRRRRFSRRKHLPLGGLPNIWKARLRYCSQLIFDASSPTSSPFSNGCYINTIRANSVYDPELTGVGHQPQGLDQLFTWYNHATVIGAKCSMTPIPSTVSNVIPGYYGILLSDDGQTVVSKVDINALLEDKALKTRRPQLAGFAYDTMRGNATKTAKFSAKKFFRKPNIVGDALYRHDSAGNPEEQAFFECYHAPVDTNNPGASIFLVEVEYIVVFTEPKTLPQS